MDKRKIFVIRFKKTHRISYCRLEYVCVADSVIMDTLKKLSETHNFKLISVDINNDSLYSSEIKIKCFSYDMPNILYDFTSKLGDTIEEVTCKRRLF